LLAKANTEPPLKPNQPIHKINVPSVASGIFAPIIAFDEPSLLYFGGSAIACTTYMVYGYDLMYGGGVMLDGISCQGDTYSNAADFFFQVVFVATAMSVVFSGYSGVLHQKN
jgi:hypothetical protein